MSRTTSRRPPATCANTDSSLPLFQPGGGRDHAILEASRAVVGLFLRERSSDFSIKELAEHAGLSERTFYRYFPRKEDAIRPYLEAGLAHLVTRVRESPRTQPLPDVLVAVHSEMFEQGHPLDGEVLLGVLNGTERLRAVWLQVLTDAEVAYAEVVAEWLGIAADSLQGRLAGAVVVTATRLALQRPALEPRAPSQVFADCLTLLGPSLFSSQPGA